MCRVDRMRNGDGSGDPRLRRLRDVPALEIADDSVDVRGWAVDSASGERLGTVADLLVDTDLLRAVYLMVDPEGTPQPAMDHPVFLVPVESARLSLAARRVTTPHAIDDLAAAKISPD